MANDFTFCITTTRLDEDYSPSDTSRITTNFANLARGARRRQNLRLALTMIDHRCNELAHWDNPHGDRYSVELEIVSVALRCSADGEGQDFPLLEILDIQIFDRLTGAHVPGIVGNNFSSYLRDYDFSVLQPAARDDTPGSAAPGGGSGLHGALFRRFVNSADYRKRYPLPPVMCLSVSTGGTYRRSENHHPILGVEYRTEDFSQTDLYFAAMGLQVRFFMPPGSVAPLAFYFRGDLLSDFTALQLIGTVSTMESFQKIYRPEIYNANSAAAAVYRPSLAEQDYSRTGVSYDRVERARLAIEQGRFAEEHLVKPHGEALARWAAEHTGVPA